MAIDHDVNCPSLIYKEIVMNFIKSSRTALVAFSLLSIGVLVWPVPSLAGKPPGGPGAGGGGGVSNTGRLTCRASALRAENLPLVGFLEPIVANPPEDPCVTDNEVFLGLTAGNILSAQVLGAVTEDSTVPVSSEGFAAGVGVHVVNLLGVNLLGLDIGVLDATARVDSVAGQCALSSQSSVLVTSATVLGIPLNVLINTHLDVPVPLVATIHFNETLGGLNPTSGAPNLNTVTQRALWIETGQLLQVLGVDDIIVGEATADFEDGNPCAKPLKIPPDKRRMTGGGTFAGVHHGFVLHCNKNRLPNNLQVNWDNGNKFHLDLLTSAACTDAPGIEESPPEAGFDTYVGAGTGSYNGASGATAAWTFTDAGEPGKDRDVASIRITDASGNVVLNVQDELNQGNHQAHK